MDKCSSDADFDSYWDNEAKNTNRNRIRVGRQYQASIPPLLKPGQKDGRKCEDLETLKWKPDQLSEQEIEEYLTVVKGIGLISKSLDNPKPPEKCENSLQSAIKGLSEFVSSHHPCNQDDGCKLAKPSSSGESSKSSLETSHWSPTEIELFWKAVESCGKNFSAIKKDYMPWKPIKSLIEFYYEGKDEKPEYFLENPDDLDAAHTPQLQDAPLPNEQSEFVISHLPCNEDDLCKLARPSSSGESSKSSLETSHWTPTDTKLFWIAVESCGKNFSAIKKDYLPWKPMKSLIDFYYKGRDEKPDYSLENPDTQDPLNTPEQQNAPLTDEQNLQKEEPVEEKISKLCSTPENPDPAPPTDPVNFLEASRVTDPVTTEVPNMKAPVPNEITAAASSTLGSLNFFLGGRLVLKLNAQQQKDGDSDDVKCQWVQSFDLPKKPNSTKKDKLKKRIFPDDSALVSSDAKQKNLNETSIVHRNQECDPSAVKKSKLTSEYDFSEVGDKSGLLLCSSSWTPPVADGQESIEADEGSSKTSEGYVSPVLSVGRIAKDNTRSDNTNSTGEFGEEPDWDLKGSCSENSALSDSASKSRFVPGRSKNSPSRTLKDISPYKQEVLNHSKSAFSQSRTSVKSLGYQLQSPSPLSKWRQWPASTHPVKSMHCSPSAMPVSDVKYSLKENPLDLSSKPKTHNPVDHRSSNMPNTMANLGDIRQLSDNSSQPASRDTSPQSSSQGSLAQSSDSLSKDVANSRSLADVSNSLSNDITNSHEDQTSCEAAHCGDRYSETPDGMSENSSQMGADYMYLHLKYHFPLAQATIEEVPLDLSSASESSNHVPADSEKLSENPNKVVQDKSEGGERGMLYQLLKSKTTK